MFSRFDTIFILLCYKNGKNRDLFNEMRCGANAISPQAFLYLAQPKANILKCETKKKAEQKESKQRSCNKVLRNKLQVEGKQKKKLLRKRGEMFAAEVDFMLRFFSLDVSRESTNGIRN